MIWLCYACDQVDIQVWMFTDREGVEHAEISFCNFDSKCATVIATGQIMNVDNNLIFIENTVLFLMITHDCLWHS